MLCLLYLRNNLPPALKEVTSSDYGNRRLIETQTQGLGHLTRLFDEIAFTPQAATEAYEQSISTDNIETHVNTITREAVQGMFNANMTDVSDEMKKNLGEHYQQLINLCPDKDPKHLVNTLLQATVTIYGQVIGDGLSAQKKTIADDDTLNEAQIKAKQNEITITYNEKVSAPMEKYCPLLTKEILLGELSEELDAEATTQQLQKFQAVVSQHLETLKTYQDELYAKLGYPISCKKDDTIMQPDSLYLNLEDNPLTGKKQCTYSIMTADKQLKTGILNIPEPDFSSTEDITDERLKTKKLAILEELTRQGAIKPLDPQLTQNVGCLQRTVRDISNQLDRTGESLEKLEAIPSSANIRTAIKNLESSRERIEKTIGDNLSKVKNEPHIQGLGERFLNAIVQFFTRGKKEYKSEETIKSESRAALPDTFQAIAKSNSMKERLQEMVKRDPSPQLTVPPPQEHNDQIKS